MSVRRLMLWAGLGLLVLIVLGAAWLYSNIRSLESKQITDDLYMLKGFGGNVAVLRTGVGAVVVDTMTFQMQGERIRERAEMLTGEPVKIVINTHYHLDHTHGNPAFRVGIRVATKRTLHHLQNLDADYWQGAAAESLPNQLVDQHQDISIGNKTLRLIHPGRGHTDGDLVVLFVEDRTLHLGDLFFNSLYPNIDLEAGGSVQHWDDTLEEVLGLAFDRVIPGHGPVTDAAGLRQFQAFIRQLAAVGTDAAIRGLSLEQTQQGAALNEDDGYGVVFVGGPDRAFVIRRAWEEATGAVVYAP